MIDMQPSVFGYFFEKITKSKVKRYFETLREK